MSDLLKTRLGWTASLALCAALVGAGCDTQPADEPVVEPGPVAGDMGMPEDDFGPEDDFDDAEDFGATTPDTGAMEGPAAGDTEGYPSDTGVDAPPPAPADESPEVNPPADTTIPVEPEPEDPGVDDEPEA